LTDEVRRHAWKVSKQGSRPHVRKYWFSQWFSQFSHVSMWNRLSREVTEAQTVKNRLHKVTAIWTLCTIYQSAQFAKYAAQFRNRTHANCKFL